MTWEVPKRTLKGTQADQARLGCQWIIELHAAGRVAEARNLWREHERKWRLSDNEFEQLHDGPGSRNIPVYRMVADALCRGDALDHGGAQLVEYARRQVSGESGLALTEWGSGIYAVPTMAALSYYYHVTKSEAVGQLLRRLVASYRLFLANGHRALVCPKERAKASTQDGERLRAWLVDFVMAGDLDRGASAEGVNGWPERITQVDSSSWYEDPEWGLRSLELLAGTTMRTEVHVIRDNRGNVAAWSPRLIGSGSTAGQSAASFMGGVLYGAPLHPPNERAGKGKSLGRQGAEWLSWSGAIRADAIGVTGWPPGAWGVMKGSHVVQAPDGSVYAYRHILAPRAEDVISHIVGDGQGWRELIAPTDESKDPRNPDATPTDPLTPFELTQARVIAHAWPTQQVPIGEIPEQPRDPIRVRRAIDALRGVEW